MVEAVDGGLKSVDNSLRLLDCLLEKQELGVSQIARKLGVAKSTTHRLLMTLCAQNFVIQNPDTGKYSLGLHLYELGQVVHDRTILRRQALPVLEELRQLTGCTVHLAIPDGPDILYLERLYSLPMIEMFTDVRRRLPTNCTSSGKIISAFNDATADARREAGFPQLTEHSIRSEREFDQALAEARVRRLALNCDEAASGFTSVAAPLLDGFGCARAAISVVGVTAEVSGNLGKLARVVAAGAQTVMRRTLL